MFHGFVQWINHRQKNLTKTIFFFIPFPPPSSQSSSSQASRLRILSSVWCFRRDEEKFFHRRRFWKSRDTYFRIIGSGEVVTTTTTKTIWAKYRTWTIYYPDLNSQTKLTAKQRRKGDKIFNVWWGESCSREYPLGYRRECAYRDEFFIFIEEKDSVVFTIQFQLIPFFVLVSYCHNKWEHSTKKKQGEPDGIGANRHAGKGRRRRETT